jgi:hypothetical protein
MNTDQRWDVVHYIRSLSTQKTHAKLKIEPIAK